MEVVLSLLDSSVSVSTVFTCECDLVLILSIRVVMKVTSQERGKSAAKQGGVEINY